MNRRSVIANLFPLLFLDTPGDGAGGGGLGDVGDFAQDMAILNSDDDDGTGAGGGKGGDGKDDDAGGDDDKDRDRDLDLLNADDDDDDSDPDDDDDPDDDSDDDQDDDKDDDKEDDKDADDKDKDTDKEPVQGRPTIKQLKAAGVLKQFPELRNIYFREAKFSEVLADPEEATEVVRKAGNYDMLEESMLQGDPKLLLTELATNNREAFNKVVTNWLPTIQELDQDTYIKVTEPVLEDLVYHAARHAQKIGDKNLLMSARHIANFVFANGGEIPDITKRGGRTEGVNPAEQKLQEERRQWQETRFREASTEVEDRVSGALERSILHNLDPDNALSDRQKKALVRDVIEELNTTLKKDQVLMRRMKTLWEQGGKDSYSKRSKESIVEAFLSGARPLLRGIRNRIRDEYLGRRPNGSGGDKKNDKKDKPRKRVFDGSRRPVDRGRERRQVLDPNKIDYNRTSDLDILNDNVKLKGER